MIEMCAHRDQEKPLHLLQQQPFVVSILLGAHAAVESHFVAVVTVLVGAGAVLVVIVVAAARWQHPSQELPGIVEVGPHLLADGHNYHDRRLDYFEVALVADDFDGDCLRSYNVAALPAHHDEGGGSYADVEGHGGSLLRLSSQIFCFKMVQYTIPEKA